MTGETEPMDRVIFQILHNPILIVRAILGMMLTLSKEKSGISGIPITLSMNKIAGKGTYLSSHTLGAET